MADTTPTPTDLPKALRLALEALEHSEPTHRHYAEPRERHAQAIAAARSALSAAAPAVPPQAGGEFLERLDSKELAAWVNHGMALAENFAMYVQADCQLRQSQARDTLRAHLFSAQPSPQAGAESYPKSPDLSGDSACEECERGATCQQCHERVYNAITITNEFYDREVRAEVSRHARHTASQWPEAFLRGFQSSQKDRNSYNGNDLRLTWIAGRHHAALRARGAMPSGWKLVPVEPTPEMCKAANGSSTNRQRWADMLAAAPQPPAALPGEQDAALSQAARDVLAERLRQINAEGWTEEHDDTHGEGGMCFAAAGYAAVASDHLQAITTGVDDTLTMDDNVSPPSASQPWPADWAFKPCKPRRALVKSGALILAELERIDRADAKEQQ